MALRKEHVALECYVNPMEPVDYNAKLMEDLEMAPRGAHVPKANFVRQMEHVLVVSILHIFMQCYGH